MMVDQSIKMQELAATRLTTKIDQLTSRLAILQEEVHTTKEDMTQWKPLSCLCNSKHKVFEDLMMMMKGGMGMKMTKTKTVISDIQLLRHTSRSASYILPTIIIDKIFKGDSYAYDIPTTD